MAFHFLLLYVFGPFVSTTFGRATLSSALRHSFRLSEQNLESANAGMVLICPSTDQNWTKQFGTNTQFLPGCLFTDTFVTDFSLVGTVWWDLQRGVRTTLLFRFVFLLRSLRQFENCVHFRLSFAMFVCSTSCSMFHNDIHEIRSFAWQKLFLVEQISHVFGWWNPPVWVQSQCFREREIQDHKD